MTATVLSGTGVKLVAQRVTDREMPVFAGRHRWVVVGTYDVAEPAREDFHLELDQIVTVEGPGCFWCEAPWSSTLGVHCPGGRF